MLGFDIKNDVFKFVEKMVGVEGLVNGQDFEIVSETVMTDDFEVHTLDTFTKKGMKGIVLETSLTPFPKTISDNFVFYKLNEEVDIGLATELGLGVVKMLTGEDSGQHFIYFPFYGSDEKWDDIDEIIALKTYLQLKHPEIHFDKLDKLVNEHRDLIESLIVLNPKRHLENLQTIFNSHTKKLLN